MLGCPYCGHTLANAQAYLGKSGRCPKCQGKYRFPTTAQGNTVGLAPGNPAPAPAKPAPAAPIPFAQLAESSPAAPLRRPRRAPSPRPRRSGLSPVLIGLLVVLAGVIGAGALWGLGKARERESLTKFNDTLARPSRSIEQESKVIGEQLRLWAEGQPIDSAILEGARRRALDTITDAERNIASLDIPGGETARRYFAATKDYLAVERTFLETEFAALVRMIRENAPREKVTAAVLAMAARAQKEEQPKVDAMRSAQEEFARAWGMKLLR